MVKVTTVRSKVKSRSHHDIAHLRLPKPVSLPSIIPCSFQDIARTDQGNYSDVKGQIKVTP